MILATVGTQLPFPRLMKALDRIANRHDLRVVAQCCEATEGLSIEMRPFIKPAEFDALAGQATVLVGHAGIGTIIGAERLSKPLILFPRRASLGEHRNEHQLATARAMAERPGIHVAWDEDELESLLTKAELSPHESGKSPTLSGLIGTVSAFVMSDVR